MILCAQLDKATVFKPGLIGQTWLHVNGRIYEVVRHGYTVLGHPIVTSVPIDSRGLEWIHGIGMPEGTDHAIGWQECASFMVRRQQRSRHAASNDDDQPTLAA